ncbi:hypothetical protein [Salinibacter altiplanensis]|uniref:hypothetical protein n=1 Tax=Salinibacter altiplanensis TaxID=1803181 RepID=UPI000C9F2728|nr:hypothetical protein [Salinibacter altiplanensis]
MSNNFTQYRKETLARFIKERMHCLDPHSELESIERRIKVDELLEESKEISHRMQALSLPEDYDEWKRLKERHSRIHTDEMPKIQD